MPTIPYRATNFSPHWGVSLSGNNLLAVTWQELVWSAITVGKPGIAYLLSHGWHSISDVVVRSHTVYANLRQTPGLFEKSTLYEGLDPTEKGATSYFVGMMAAKIVAARLLETPWLLHLSMFRTLGGSPVIHGKSEPDLVGLNTSGGWIVVEAKGRTHGLSKDAMAAAKAQTRRLRMINGTYPSLRVAIQAYFAPELRFEISDPDEFDEDARDLEFDLVSALRMYYSAAYSSTQRQAEVTKLDDREYLVHKNEETGVTIGIALRAKELLDAGDAAGLTEGARSFSKKPRHDSSSSFTLFPDGLAIALDERWSESRMRRGPTARRGG